MRILMITAIAVILCSCSSGESSEPGKSNMGQTPGAMQTPEIQSMEFVPPKDGKLSDEHMKMYISVKIKERMLEQSQEQSGEVEVNSTQTMANQGDSGEAHAAKATITERVEQAKKADTPASESIAVNNANADDYQLQTPTDTADTSESDTSMEQLAVREFGYDANLYKWIKETVVESMARNSIDSVTLQTIKDKQQVKKMDSPDSATDAVTVDTNVHNDAIVARYAQELAFAHRDYLTDGDPKSASNAENVAKQPAEPTVTQPTGS